MTVEAWIVGRIVGVFETALQSGTTLQARGRVRLVQRGYEQQTMLVPESGKKGRDYQVNVLHSYLQ